MYASNGTLNNPALAPRKNNSTQVQTMPDVNDSFGSKMATGVVNSNMPDSAIPPAPRGRMPNSPCPADQYPASTLPIPTPNTSENNRGFLAALSAA